MSMNDWAARYGRWALIAGGSEGIGRAFADRLAAAGVNLILLARNPEPLREARTEIHAKTGVTVETYALDLTADDLAARLDDIISDREIGTLIYNAGAVHGAGLLLDAPVEKALHLIRLNCVGPVVFTHALATAMRERGRGAIILVSSMSGLAGGGYVAAYAASKAYETTLAESLWIELGSEGIDVLGLIAGATMTPSMARSGLRFSEGDGAATESLDIVPMDPVDVVDEALAALGHGPVHVAGERNRAGAEWIRSSARAEIVTTMSAAGASMYGLPRLAKASPA